MTSKPILNLPQRTAQMALLWLAGLFIFTAGMGYLLSSLGSNIPDWLRRYSLQIFLLIALTYLFFAAAWRPRLLLSNRTLKGTLIVLIVFLGGLKILDLALSFLTGPAEGSQKVFGLTSQMLLGVIIAPILEELFFRDLIFRSLMTKWRTLVAPVLISSLFFMLAHTSLYPGAFLLGILSAWLFYFTESIVPSILLHAISNLSWFFLPALYPNLFKMLLEWNLLQYFYR